MGGARCCLVPAFGGVASHVARAARLVCILAPAFTLAASRAAGQQKYALVVGVDDYGAYEDEIGGDLLGAERDALQVRDVLVARWDVPEANVRTLLSRDATKAAIHEAITGWLASRAGAGDLAVFYFAGHGSQALDLDGDEPDGLDETLAPTDVEPLSTEHDIRDDELREWLGLVAADVVVILDSCHSGSATRGGGSMRPRVLGREIPDEPGFEPGAVRQRADPESMADGSRSIVEIAAAAPNQSAMEGAFPTVDGGEAAPGGAFTYHLVRQLWRAGPDATYDDLVSRVVASLKADRFTQDPQLEGPASRPLFGGTRSKALPPAPKAIGGAGTEGLPARPTLRVDVSELTPELSGLARSASADAPRVELLERTGGVTDLLLRPSQDGSTLELVARDGGVRREVAVAEGARAALAAALRAELSVTELASLENPQARFAVELSVAGGRRELEPGDSLELTVRSGAAGYLTLVQLRTDGTMERPAVGTAVRLSSGAVTTVPAAGGGYAVGSIPGEGFFLALMTATLLAAGGSTSDLLAQVRSELRGLAGSPGAWSTGLLAYRVAGR